MGNKKSRPSDHVAFSSSQAGPVPNIVITSPTPLVSPSSPQPFVPPNTPSGYRSFPENSVAPPPSPQDDSDTTDKSSGETMILAGTPPPDRPPPPPPVEEDYSDVFDRYSSLVRFDRPPPKLPTVPPPPIPDEPPLPPPRSGPPTIKRNIIYAKDRIAQFEALNTTDRKKGSGTASSSDAGYYSIKNSAPSKFKPFSSIASSAPVITTTPTSTVRSSKLSGPNECKLLSDDYPIYNPISDFSFKSGMNFQQTAYPIDANRINIGFCGRQGAGKSTLINALRGISLGDSQSAGRNPCDTMEPFRFIEDNLQQMVLWEIPYPRTFTSVVDLYDRNMGFDKLYDSYKLNIFRHLFVLVPDGSLHDDDICFSRVIQSRYALKNDSQVSYRRTTLTILSTKTDDDIDAEAREMGRHIDEELKKDYERRARTIFSKGFHSKAQVLSSVDIHFISAPVIRNIVSGTTGYLHYKMDEELLLSKLDLKAGCHYSLENKLRKEKEELGLMRPNALGTSTSLYGSVSPVSRFEFGSDRGGSSQTIQKSTVLVYAGFEILYGTDDRVFGNLEPQTTVRRAGRTTFNYGFIGKTGMGKSAMINAMRGMSSKHPLAAGKSKGKPGFCDRFEFDDDLLRYNVTLWEMHYPKKVNSYFEYIDRHNVSSFTAIFVLIEGIPSDEDLAFSKIAHRRNASVVFLSSKSDKKLAWRSRSDEIPVCDLLKQRFVDKSLTRFDRALSQSAPELCGRVHAFFVSAPVFRAIRTGKYQKDMSKEDSGETRAMQYILHERAVFDFLKQKRIIADLLDSPGQMKEGLYANVNTDTAGVDVQAQPL